jgi:hypothetical protein
MWIWADSGWESGHSADTMWPESSAVLLMARMGDWARAVSSASYLAQMYYLGLGPIGSTLWQMITLAAPEWPSSLRHCNAVQTALLQMLVWDPCRLRPVDPWGEAQLAQRRPRINSATSNFITNPEINLCPVKSPNHITCNKQLGHVSYCLGLKPTLFIMVTIHMN